jgi:hypothetical protein
MNMSYDLGSPTQMFQTGRHKGNSKSQNNLVGFHAQADPSKTATAMYGNAQSQMVFNSNLLIKRQEN